MCTSYSRLYILCVNLDTFYNFESTKFNNDFQLFSEKKQVNHMPVISPFINCFELLWLDKNYVSFL